ncbi:hypothetical protein PsYK624_100010 [Phanerochaete sordida]|uniref:Uncharacterized protein n=1 Tax=Phanerochaete sordida TaxID=48140 RepID=A0A9P3LH77_9APHY|nr:hypothetical protein PsYK624_100010 [Phanerochaete sordida]
MLPVLFTGKACFSPSVPGIVRTAWVKCGGTLADGDAHGADFYFCDGRTDACYASWIDRNTVVFHWRWVSNAAFARFPVPIAPYVLNDCGYDFEERVPSVRTTKALKVEERSQTTVDIGPSDEYLQSTSFDEGPSGITLVGEESLDKVVDIPFIDLTKIKAPAKRASSQLRIDHFCGDKRFAARQKQRPVVPLPFRSGSDQIPRLSFGDARQALRHLDINMSTIIKHNDKHLGKRLRCGYCTKSPK